MSEDNDVYNEFMQDRDEEAVQPAKPKKPRSKGKDLSKIAPKGKVVKKVAAAKKQPAKKPQPAGKVLNSEKVGFTKKVSANSIAKQSKKNQLPTTETEVQQIREKVLQQICKKRKVPRRNRW